MEILYGRVVNFKLGQELTPHKVVCLHRELLHLEDHLLQRVKVVYANLRYLRRRWLIYNWLLLLNLDFSGLKLYLLVFILHGAHLLALFRDLPSDLLLDALGMLEDLLHCVCRGGAMLLEDL
jgi:hypothetical protein